MAKFRFKQRILKFLRSFSRYFIDLLIVAFGVFLALYVGERNNQKKTDQNTLNALTQIISELEANARNLENSIAYHEKISVELDSLSKTLDEEDYFLPFLEHYKKFNFTKLPSWKGYIIAKTNATFYESAKVSGIFNELNINTIQVITNVYDSQKQYSDVANLSLNKLLDLDSNTKIVDVSVLIERLVKEDLFHLETTLLSEANAGVERLKEIVESKGYKK
ncbi:hypothetical protein SAMN04488057_11223 [Cyclobacterium lianum]|uniref:Uncharacterized protein n=1 Tax=Cyclobacterium lianum TaxID=388280 RepID=A0A1M7PYU2_9BACT|nr:hypothetical protein [Cyclobacterium lianum]SHN22863.1 hypothetical protein SAMN04488057_11223 [Cyclobacterium lianum]